LTEDGVPKIGDFGLAKHFAADTGFAAAGCTESGALLGTPNYMAPEQATGRNQDVGRPADVYALGAILYECLTGRPPFKAASVLETLEQVRTQEPVPPGRLQPRLPRDLQTICLKCLEKEPRRRYASANAFADDLEQYLAGKPIAARAVGWWERASKWARRKPAASALLMVIALSAIALTAGAVVYNARLRESVALAEANEAEARRERARAQDYYRKARGTLDEVLAQLNQFRLGEVPQLRELQRRQVEKALTFYEGALETQDVADPAVRTDTAFACKRAGDLQNVLGRHADAAANYQRAIGLLAALPSEDRDTPANQFLLATCYNHRGLLANSARRWDDAAQDHRKALEIVEGMLAKNPGVPQWRASVAETEHFLGALFQVSGNNAEAEAHQQRAAAIYSELAHDLPEVEGYPGKLAEIEVNLALLYQQTKRLAQARRVYEQAEGRLHSLLKRHPAAGDHQLSLGALYANWGLLLRGTGEMPAALDKHMRAVELTEGVLKQEPKHLAARHLAYNAHGSRAQIYEALGRWSDAVPDWDRVVELDAQPNHWLNRALRAMALARAGQHARATAEAQTLAKDTKVSADGIYSLACVYALSAQQAPLDKAADAAERKTLAEQYATHAVALLGRLRDQGYFQNATHGKTLATDLDLQVLRDRADFKKLLPSPEADRK
jgi:tetratricopeptide (TPR) repeat protein